MPWKYCHDEFWNQEKDSERTTRLHTNGKICSKEFLYLFTPCRWTHGWLDIFRFFLHLFGILQFCCPQTVCWMQLFWGRLIGIIKKRTDNVWRLFAYMYHSCFKLLLCIFALQTGTLGNPLFLNLMFPKFYWPFNIIPSLWAEPVWEMGKL